MSEWSEENFEVVSNEGRRSVMGLVSGAFGIYFDEHRNRPGWVVTHMGTGMSIAGWQPFDSVDIAKEFVARVRPLADWNDVDPESPSDVGLEINEIVDELHGGDPLADLMRVPPYMGDDAFRAFLEKHGCPTSIEVMRLRFLGAAVSPGREADVYPLVEDLFDYQMPELNERELVDFLHAFLGLFQEVEKASRQSPVTLPPVGAIGSHEGVKDLLSRRIDEVVFGFLEGVWQDDDELSLSEPQAAMLTAIEEAARTYEVRFLEIISNEQAAATPPVTDLLREIAEIDQAVETAMTSLLEAFRNDRSTDRPLMKRANALIDELDISAELPRDAIRQCVARRDEMVPIFLSILRDNSDGTGAIDDREAALFLIIHILGELGEQRAFAPLMDLLAGESEQIEEVLGDSVTENLPRILISVFDGDTERFYGLMNNPDADEYVRFAAFEAWTYHVAAGRIDRAEAEQYLSSAFERLQPQEEHLIWVAWLEAIGHLGFTDLRATVRTAFDIGRIPPMSILFSEFEEILDAASRSDDLVAFVGEDRLAPFTNTIEVLSSWHCFSEEYIRANAKAEREPAPPIRPFQPVHTVTNPVRHVGRNDPCPCGSGKKFKKCCLQ